MILTCKFSVCPFYIVFRGAFAYAKDYDPTDDDSKLIHRETLRSRSYLRQYLRSIRDACKVSEQKNISLFEVAFNPDQRSDIQIRKF